MLSTDNESSFEDKLNLICQRAGELAEMNVKQLRLLHPDNIEGTCTGQQWMGVSKGRLIQDILFEEFSAEA